MSNPRALVFGGTGMLGSAVVEELNLSGIETLVASRSQGIKFNAENQKCDFVFEKANLSPGDYVINCLGLTKRHINQQDPITVKRAVNLNVIFPMEMEQVAKLSGFRVVQVATDCVFSGREGQYSEISVHDAHDAYGKTKSLGEVFSDNVMHLRCSLVGPESNHRNTLFFEWVRKLPRNSVVDGYVNHKWNGLTSKAFGQIVSGIVKSQEFISGVQHLVPHGSVTKYDLVEMELELLGRRDVKLEKVKSGEDIDRTLSTIRPETNRKLFKLGGYPQLPSIREMMEELPWEQLKQR